MEDSLSQIQLTRLDAFTDAEYRKASDKTGIQDYKVEMVKNGVTPEEKYIDDHKFKPNHAIKLQPLGATQPQTRSTKGSNNPFFHVAEINPSMVISTDRLGIIEYVNPSFLNTTGYVWQEVEGQQIKMLTSGVELLPNYYDLKRAIKAGKSWKGELKSRKKSGEVYFVSVIVSPAVDDLGFVTNFVVVAQDISSFKATKKQLKRSSEQNKVLLSELHHRVKNNLAIITGLMQLQAFNEADEGIQNKLLSSVGRIQTMAAMHDLLYKTNNFVRLNFGESMKNIVSLVAKMYHIVSSDVEIEMDIESIELDINQAHSCSLIVHEVVSNVFKHAFDAGTADNSLSLRLYTINKTVYIEVEDNGKGLATNFEKYNQDATLGFKLLLTLVRQLNGEYCYKKNRMGGTSFILQFQRQKVKGSSNAQLT